MNAILLLTCWQISNKASWHYPGPGVQTCSNWWFAFVDFIDGLSLAYHRIVWRWNLRQKPRTCWSCSFRLWLGKLPPPPCHQWRCRFQKVHVSLAFSCHSFSLHSVLSQFITSALTMGWLRLVWRTSTSCQRQVMHGPEKSMSSCWLLACKSNVLNISTPAHPLVQFDASAWRFSSSTTDR